MIQRTEQEVCQPISKYYNPLYAPGKNNAPTGGEYCDDNFGDKVGEYHCLGIVFYTRLWLR